MNTNKLRRLSSVALCALICISAAISFSGCENGKTQSATSDEVATTSQVPASTADEATAVGALESLGIDASTIGIEPNILYDTENPVGFQLEMPNEGDTIAVVHTTLGDFTMRFFPEQAPKTVTNFINLAKEGNYNNTTFHRVVRDFIVQGGHCGNDENAPNGTSSYGTEFEDEFCDKLFNVRGAVSMANSAQDTNGSQFFINQTSAEAYKNNGGWSRFEKMWQTVKTQLANYKDSNLLSAFIQKNGNNCYDTEIVPEEVRSLYETNGGNPYLDGAYNAVDRGHTVFAQVIDGMDVVDKIAVVQVDDDDKPVENVVIKSIDITTYSPQKAQTTSQNTGTTSAE
ncbi:MAG: peptidylprolyl isomerase [Ruminococcus sp.]